MRVLHEASIIVAGELQLSAQLQCAGVIGESFQTYEMTGGKWDAKSLMISCSYGAEIYRETLSMLLDIQHLQTCLLG